MMEIYKQEERKGTVKSKSLHSNFSIDNNIAYLVFKVYIMDINIL